MMSLGCRVGNCWLLRAEARACSMEHGAAKARAESEGEGGVGVSRADGSELQGLGDSGFQGLRGAYEQCFDFAKKLTTMSLRQVHDEFGVGQNTQVMSSPNSKMKIEALLTSRCPSGCAP